MNLPAWTREPLVHFLGLGAIVYVVLAWGGEPVDPSSRVISVDAQQQAQLAISFEGVIGRAPTDAELDARIEQYVREEVLYREAIRLGLDQDDAVVRQRMVAKMDLTASAAAEAAEPNDDTLRAFFEENREDYSGQATLSFDQLYFSSESAATAAIEAGATEGEAISLPATIEDEAIGEVRALFGEAFAASALALDPSDEWQGPIGSGFGWHLVRMRIRDVAPGEFEQVRDRVENDWRSAEIEARKQRAFEVLREPYRIEIER